MSQKPIIGKTLQQQLVDAGILPELCSRVVIDIPCASPVSIYYESYGSSKLLELDLPRYLQDAVKINVVDMKGKENEQA